jgi:porin
MRKKYAAAVICFLLVLATASPAHSYNSDKFFHQTRDLRHETRYMTGNWENEREELSDKGITFNMTFVFDLLGNPFGGNERGARYDHSMGWDVNFDLEKFAGMLGTQFHVSGLWRQGQNLSKATIGNSIVCSTIYGHEQFRFYFLYLEKTFLNDRFNLRVGRIATGDDFAASPLYWTFISNGIDGMPITIPINLFYTVYPTTTWGARLKTALFGDFNMMSGLYNGDEGVGRDCMYGLDFSLRLKKGIMYAQEFSYNPNTKPGATGMPGNYKVGFYYDSGVFRDVYYDINGNSAAVSGLDNKKHIGNYGLYFHADQLIYRENKTTDQGLTPLFVACLAPDNINQFVSFLMTGVIYKGLIPGFDQDLTAAQMTYVGWSDQWSLNNADAGNAPQKFEAMFELTYKKFITPWMYLQPDMQYIIRPGGTGKIKDALVVGAQFGLIF